MAADNIAKRVWQDPLYFIAFGFGSGLIPIAPGTFGTLAAVPLYLILSDVNWLIYLAFTVLGFFLGTWISDRVSSDLGVDDYSGIVVDEIIGYLFTMFLAPSGVLWLILGFILFRIFDILKPQPIKLIDQKVFGGFGIMLDDLLAAIPAWIILQFFVWAFHVK